MSGGVEKMEVDSPRKEEQKKTREPAGSEEQGKDVDTLFLENLREHCRLIERGENTKEPRFVTRVLRALVTTRKRLNATVLQKFLQATLTSPSTLRSREFLLGFLKMGKSGSSSSLQPMEVDKTPGGGGSAGAARSPRSARKTLSQTQQVPPGVEIYAYILVLLLLIDEKTRMGDARKCVDALVKRIESLNKRSLDPLAAKAYFYYTLVYERNGQIGEIRDFLHARLRTATLRHEEESQATLINSLLRSYISQQLYQLAGKLEAKVTFPESANNNEWARHLYYLGRIRAMQLEYTKAQKFLLQCLRKAPQHSAVGFKQSVQKFAVVVDLLLGEIPERSLFRQPMYKKSLVPYLQLTQAVRTGDVHLFNECLEKRGKAFERDGTCSLIVRLRQNVIKTAVRQIATAYSRISIPDIQKKLELTHPDDAEFIVSKAIKDGVIEANLDHSASFMQSGDTADVYGTTEPQHQYHSRIAFCLELYNQAVKAMRFPPKSYNKDIESAEEQREREQQELEFAKELAEDDDDLI